MEFETNFVYICPDCFLICVSRLNIFSLSSGLAHKFICKTNRCFSECASIKKTAPEQYIIEVSCPFCGEKHSKRLSGTNIWQRSYGTVRCPYAAADVFFYGNDKTAIDSLVKRSADIFEHRLRNMNAHISEAYSDPILSEILMNLERLMNDNQVSCVCGSEDIVFRLSGNRVALSCRRCGRNKELEISKENLLRLINASGIVLGQ